MKYLNQFAIILFLWMLGELVSRIIKPVIFIPGTIVGMLLMCFFLIFNLIKEKQIKEISDFFLSNIAFFFIPAAVGILSISGIDAPTMGKIVFLVITSTMITMIVTSLVTDFMIKITKRR